MALAAIAVAVTASSCAANIPAGASGSTPSSTAPSSTAPDPDAARIISIASAAAKGNGDSAPTAIQWVRARRGAIAQLMEFGVPTDQQDVNEILVLVTGSFTSTRGQLPTHAGSTSRPSGRNLEIVLDPDTWATTDSGIGDFTIDLSSLGVAHSE